ncbi:hypothetical protein HHX47_DHR2000572 [Lentinula edodes]|nr:hypothetical protein HHX47_DHR2000572 [Lentinula edodes]
MWVFTVWSLYDDHQLERYHVSRFRRFGPELRTYYICQESGICREYRGIFWNLSSSYVLNGSSHCPLFLDSFLNSLMIWTMEPHTVMAYIMEDISPSGKGNQRQLRREGKSSGGRVESSRWRRSFQSSRPEASSRLL